MNKKVAIIIISILIVIILGVIFYNQTMRIKEGEIFYTNIKYQTFKHCAGGLKILAVIDDLPSGITQDECYKYRPVGSLTRVCSNCGNNNCEPWENICTCSEDCQ